MKVFNYIKNSQFLISQPLLIVIVAFFSIVINLLFFSDFSEAHLLYIEGVASFVFAYFFVFFIYNLTKKKKSLPTKSVICFSRSLIRVYSTIGVFGALIGCIIFFKNGFGGESLFFNLRVAHTINNESLYGAQHFGLFSLVISALHVLMGNYKRAIAFIFLYMIPVLAAAERTGILYGFSFIAYIWASTRPIKFYKLISGFAVLIILFVLVANSAGKLYSEDMFFLIPYLGYGITAFDNWVLGYSTPYCYAPTFGVVGVLIELVSGYIFGCHCNEIDLAPDGSFNVYTYLASPYLLGGEIGLIAVMFIFGMLIALFKICEKFNNYFLFINASFLFSIIMIFYAWTFSLTTHLYIALITIPLFFKFSLMRNDERKSNIT